MSDEPKDPYIWMEEVLGEKPLNWVREQNALTEERLAGDPRFEAIKARALETFTSKDRIPYGAIYNDEVYNFWQDENHVRGVLRKTSLDDYLAAADKWTTVLDIDALAKAEDENWVYKGRDCLAPEYEKCLIRLSRGGADAVVIREFDLTTNTFVEGGFYSPESKQRVDWMDGDTLLIGTDFGEGSMNTSGYARQVRTWSRGTPLSEASLIFEGREDWPFTFPSVSARHDGKYVLIGEMPDFFTQSFSLFDGGEILPLTLPLGIDFQGFFRDQMMIQMRDDWTVGDITAPRGSLISVKIDDLVKGTPANSLQVIFEPSQGMAIQGVSIGRDRILVDTLVDVKGQLFALTPSGAGWDRQAIDLPANGSIRIISNSSTSDNAFINFESHLQPDTLFHLDASGALADIRSLPAKFDASALQTVQKFAVSPDGTKIPYFLISQKDTELNGETPTLLYAYGGFEISQTPDYLGGVGMLWLEAGGAYAVANIRGGGEYGPDWHQAALKENRQKAFDDFIAVAEDLIASGLTSPAHLGIRGGSNGGLLMGAMITQRPDLFNAVICAVPLLDMLRYHKLLAGASWIGEYGDPENAEDRAWIKQWSPYQKVGEHEAYPEVYFYTSTRDDRVHPGHARKMARKMIDMGHPVLYHENIEGGHSAAANLKQAAYSSAMQMTYLLQKLTTGSQGDQ